MSEIIQSDSIWKINNSLAVKLSNVSGSEAVQDVEEQRRSSSTDVRDGGEEERASCWDGHGHQMVQCVRGQRRRRPSSQPRPRPVPAGGGGATAAGLW